LTHVCKSNDVEARFDLAHSLLKKYAEARAVVTSRLHCALPCLALGTPVLFIENASDSYRFDGLRDLLRRATADGILSGRCDFDFMTPPDNRTAWHGMRDDLIEKCTNFIGAKNKLKEDFDANILFGGQRQNAHARLTRLLVD
jgi:hypothetical protein